MRVTETMIRKNNLEREYKRKNQDQEPDHMEMNKMWDAKKGNYLNSPTPVHDFAMETGINIQQSIFDKQATFLKK